MIALKTAVNCLAIADLWVVVIIFPARAVQRAASAPSLHVPLRGRGGSCLLPSALPALMAEWDRPGAGSHPHPAQRAGAAWVCAGAVLNHAALPSGQVWGAHRVFRRQEETIIVSPMEKRLFRAGCQTSSHGLKIPKAAHHHFCWFLCCSDASELLVAGNVQAYGMHFISVCV